MSPKSDYVTNMRAVPTGITEFLTTPIPTPPVVQLPTTEAEAAIIQGVLGYYILEFFRPFGGLFPVELMLRIGQHSNPIEAMCLAGLEYLAESDAQQEFEIISPVDGQTYTQGDVRITVKAKSSKIALVAVTVACEVGSEFAVDLQSDDGQTWYGFARCEQVLAYTFGFSVTFNDDNKTTKTATLTITIAAAGTPEAEDAANPEGEDLDAFNVAADQFDASYQAAIKAMAKLDEGEVEEAWLDPTILLGLGGAVKSLSKLGVMLAGEVAVSISNALVAEYEQL